MENTLNNAQNLVLRFAWLYDAGNREILASLFHPDATFQIEIADQDPIDPIVGREAIVEMITGSMADQKDKRRHVMSNLIIEDASEDTVVISSYLTLVSVEDGSASILSSGHYRDTIVMNHGGQWVFSVRHLTLDKPY